MLLGMVRSLTVQFLVNSESLQIARSVFRHAGSLLRTSIEDEATIEKVNQKPGGKEEQRNSEKVTLRDCVPRKPRVLRHPQRDWV